jgi:hypothetical protein
MRRIAIITGLILGLELVLSHITPTSSVKGFPPQKPAAQNETVSAAKIIENYIRACCGPHHADIKTEIRKGTLLRGKSGKAPLKITSKAPGKWRYQQVFAWGDQVCYGCDGDTAWVQDSSSVSQMSPQQQQEMRMLMDFQFPLFIQKLYPRMMVTGTETIGKNEAYTVLATSPEGYIADFAFDKKTGLLFRAGRVTFEDYRSVGDVKRPFRIILGKEDEAGENHLPMKMEFSDTQHNLPVDDAQFQSPGCALIKVEPPLYKRRILVELSVAALEACVGVYQHPEIPNVTYTVTRQQNHLMLERTGWGQRMEIKPESENDYYMQFLSREFQFLKDNSGKVTHIVIKAPGEPWLKAKKIR